MMFDLLIKGGEVVDPAAGFSGNLDVAIKRNRIAAIERDIPAASAFKVIDAAGRYVTPGLVDLHTHVYHHCTYWGIDPDPVAARTGVTTWLDVGSAGVMNILGLRQFVAKPATARIYALLNISSIGLTAATHELANLAYCDVDVFRRLVDVNRDFVLGVKARIDRNTVGANGIEPLRRARQAADECELPLMVHIAEGPPDVREVLALLKPNDIVTHCFTGRNMRLLDGHGDVLELARRAREEGIIMDIGHGAGSFSFESAEALLAAGFAPDVISSDIHQLSINGPMFDLPTCLSKFLMLGMSFPDVIRAATSRPAEVLGLEREIGTLHPGALADVALFTVVSGRFPFYDVEMHRRDGTQLIRNMLTILNGRPLRTLPAEPLAPWLDLSEAQQELIRRGHVSDAMVADAAATTGRRSVAG